MAFKLNASATYRPELAGAVREYDTVNAMKEQFIAERVLPEVVEPVITGQYPIIDKENFRKAATTSRAPGGAFNRGDWSWNLGNFTTVENAHEIPIDKKKAAAYANVLDAEEESAIGVDYIVRLAHERRVAAAVMNATTFSATNVAVTWATLASSTPLVDIDAGCNTLEDALGVPRSMLSLICSRLRWQNLRSSAEVIDRLKAWNSGIHGPENIREKVLADYLDVKEIIVGASTYDSTEEGVAQSFSAIWPDQYGMLALLAPAPTAPRKTLCLGRTVRWNDGTMPDFVTIETYDDESVDSRIVRARQFTAEKIISVQSGYLLDLTAAS